MDHVKKFVTHLPKRSSEKSLSPHEIVAQRQIKSRLYADQVNSQNKELITKLPAVRFRSRNGTYMDHRSQKQPYLVNMSSHSLKPHLKEINQSLNYSVFDNNSTGTNSSVQRMKTHSSLKALNDGIKNKRNIINESPEPTNAMNPLIRES